MNTEVDHLSEGAHQSLLEPKQRSSWKSPRSGDNKKTPSSSLPSQVFFVITLTCIITPFFASYAPVKHAAFHHYCNT